jgi:hypothetical protein
METGAAVEIKLVTAPPPKFMTPGRILGTSFVAVMVGVLGSSLQDELFLAYAIAGGIGTVETMVISPFWRQRSHHWEQVSHALAAQAMGAANAIVKNLQEDFTARVSKLEMERDAAREELAQLRAKGVSYE